MSLSFLSRVSGEPMVFDRNGGQEGGWPWRSQWNLYCPSPFIAFHLFVSVFASVLGSAFAQCSCASPSFFLMSSLDLVSCHAGEAFAVSQSSEVFHWEVEGGWGVE